MRLATRMSRLGTETAFEALARARALEAQGRSIIHLGIGEPDFDTPEHIRDAAKQALDQGHTHYTPSPGVMDAREAIARHQTLRQGYEVAPSSVIVTPGGKPVMFFTILALAEPGDEVIYPNPGFPHLRIDDPLRRGDARGVAAARGERLRGGRGRTALAGLAAHQTHHRQLAQQPVRQRHPARRLAPHRRDSERGGHDGAER